MLSLIVYRITTMVWMIIIFIAKKIKDSDYKNSGLAEKFLDYNNKAVIKRLKGKNISGDRVMIMLPHCIQNYDCGIKITSDVARCVKCGKCDIGAILTLKEKYNIPVKVATGGTLARKHIKEIRPKLVIAVACERDLISGIYDSFPMPVIGFFNQRVNGPCYNTKVAVAEIDEALAKIIKPEEKHD